MVAPPFRRRLGSANSSRDTVRSIGGFWKGKPVQTIQAVVVGASQAGLATSHELKRVGIGEDAGMVVDTVAGQ
jgi:hypothetical protein